MEIFKEASQNNGLRIQRPSRAKEAQNGGNGQWMSSLVYALADRLFAYE